MSKKSEKDATPSGNFNTAYMPSTTHQVNQQYLDEFTGVYGEGEGDAVATEDLVNHPPHYKGDGVIECIDAIESAVSANPNTKEIPSQANILKYIWRYFSKDDPVQDLQKCRFYLDRLIKMRESK